jgi:methionine sulfoxide reductase heme-binding subunit
MDGITSSTALWYASRATGVVSLVLLSAVMILGILVNRQGQPRGAPGGRPSGSALPGLPRFGVLGLHRNLSLLAVAFVAVHVITAVADSYVSISLAATVIPFVSSYEPLWLGLGAVSLDLMAAVIVTSLLRRHIGRRAWRGVHWAAYASWPVAVAHGIGSSRDLRGGPFLALAIVCMVAVAAALAWRLAAARAGRTARLTPLAQAALAQAPLAQAPLAQTGLPQAAQAQTALAQTPLAQTGPVTLAGHRRGLTRAGDR